MSDKVEVSVIVPVYNEEKYIGRCIETVLKQDYNKKRIEVLLVDGASTDKTCEIILSYCHKYPFIHLLHNPNKTVPYAMNIGIRQALGEYVVRLDAHSEYADDYISKCMEYLEKTKADNVGGPTIARGKDNMQKVIAASYSSAFALGWGGQYKFCCEGYVDTVFLGAYKKETLLRIGLYDEKFSCNEDDELNYRIIKNGGKIFMTPAIRSIYYPRNSLKELFVQYYRYGKWKVAVIRKHGKPARISHLIPVSFVCFNILGIVMSFLSIVRWIYGLVVIFYWLINLYFSITNKHVSGVKNKFMLCLVHFVLHVSYGLGFFKGLLISPISNPVRKQTDENYGADHVS